MWYVNVNKIYLYVYEPRLIQIFFGMIFLQLFTQVVSKGFVGFFPSTWKRGDDEAKTPTTEFAINFCE